MGLNEIEVNRKLLEEVDQIVTAKTERVEGIQIKIADLKKKVAEQMDKGLWDNAQTSLLQARGLSVESLRASDEASQASARSDTLRKIIAKEEEKERLAKKPSYVPYQPEAAPVAPAPAATPPVAAPGPDGLF